MVTRLVRAPRIDFSSLRRELDLPDGYPLAALREADQAAAAAAHRLDGAAAGRDLADRTDIAFVTVDPQASRDLDQALHMQRRGSGFRVRYAIADVAAFVPIGGELEAQTWLRGETIYLPDGRVPLHPLSLSEGAASLLPGQLRMAIVWTIDLDSSGTPNQVRLERAIVRSRAKLDYAGVQRDTLAGRLPEAIELLPTIGQLLLDAGFDRGAIDLPIPEQELEPDRGGWRIVLRSRLPAESWNAQISLLTGRCAADIMLAGRVGLLRTMPSPSPTAVAAVREVAGGLGLDWPDDESVGRVIASLDPAQPRAAALIDQAAELLRGASYTAMDGTLPALTVHGGVGAPYAHVTAPLRRLADRYATHVCLRLVAGQEIDEHVRSALPRLPQVMDRSGRVASAATRGAIDLAEAVLLAGRVGERFDAVVLDAVVLEDGASRMTVAIDEPPVRARCHGAAELGERIAVRLVEADPARRLIRFSMDRPAPGQSIGANGPSLR